jgi:phosphoribosylformylglycinamidine synthase
VPRPDAGAPARYRALHAAIVDGLVVACHDVSEGGLAVAIAEMCIASGLGARIDTLPHDDVAAAWFSESAGRFVLEVRPGDVAALARRLTPCTTLGRITAQPVLELAGSARLEVAALTAAFHGGRP